MVDISALLTPSPALPGIDSLATAKPADAAIPGFDALLEALGRLEPVPGTIAAQQAAAPVTTPLAPPVALPAAPPAAGMALPDGGKILPGRLPALPATLPAALPPVISATPTASEPATRPAPRLGSTDALSPVPTTATATATAPLRDTKAAGEALHAVQDGDLVAPAGALNPAFNPAPAPLRAPAPRGTVAAPAEPHAASEAETSSPAPVALDSRAGEQPAAVDPAIIPALAMASAPIAPLLAADTPAPAPASGDTAPAPQQATARGKAPALAPPGLAPHAQALPAANPTPGGPATLSQEPLQRLHALAREARAVPEARALPETGEADAPVIVLAPPLAPADASTDAPAMTLPVLVRASSARAAAPAPLASANDEMPAATHAVLRQHIEEHARTALPAATVMPPADAARIDAAHIDAADIGMASPLAQPLHAASGDTPVGAVPRQTHDLAALVDRLVEARAAAAPQSVTAAVAHADFGRVTLHFAQDDTGLSVGLSSPDPDFARAAQAAASTAPQTTAAQAAQAPSASDASGAAASALRQDNPATTSSSNGGQHPAPQPREPAVLRQNARTSATGAEDAEPRAQTDRPARGGIFA